MSTQTAPASAQPQLASLDTLRERLVRLNPSYPASKIIWSAVLHDDAGAYRAMWFGHSSTLRADVDGADHVTRLSMHSARSANREFGRGLVVMMIGVTAPAASAHDQAEVADALGGIMSRDLTSVPANSSIDIAGVRVTPDMGALDYDLAVSPRA